MDAVPYNANATLNLDHDRRLEQALDRGCRADTDRDGGKAVWVELIELGAWHGQQRSDLRAEPLGLSRVT